MVNSRIVTFDLLKLLAIILVVWGHCMQHLLSVPTEENALFLWITSFHMPLFMTLAGMFSVRTFSRTWQSYIKNRSRQLLLPWLSWSIIVLLIIFLFEGPKTPRYILGLFFNSLWFLKSLFICGLLALIGFKIPGNRLFWVFSSLIISQFLLVWNVFVMYPCFLFGVLCSRQMSYIHSHLKQFVIVTGIAFLLLSIWAANSPEFWMRNLDIRKQLIEGSLSLTQQVSFVLLIVVKRYSQVLLGCLGTLFFISLFKLVFDKSTRSFISSISLFGQFTLGVYVIQTIIVETVLPHLMSISASYKLLFNFVIAPIITLIVVAIALYINILIQNRGGVFINFIVW